MDNQIDDESIVLAAATVVAIIALQWYSRRRGLNLPREPCYNRDQQRTNYISRIIHGSEEASIAMLRMKRVVFFGLCDLLKSKGLLYNTLHVSVEEQVAMFLHILGHKVRNRVIGVNFLLSGETISRYFKHVLYAIGELRGEFIQPPRTTTSSVITHDPRFMPYFKDCIGALDGTHIHASVRKEIVARFRGRKPYPTQNVLAAVDFELRFTYVLAGWEGSAHDALVLRDALEREDGLIVPEDGLNRDDPRKRRCWKEMPN
ncbi:uncharacterized protein LOC120265748 [Dioscorea cayenensis subsp. rotundata]|uniref:Uncharacterized protein LOC120265748 n=1 Tax=Dioscorea cayennensis subsp. rotundata TaxID=55577 RepID=A0AB40BT66_DIOCR|nr:uncharacterized protein LOC120265748 [Dioscorea cayenensis subsp. rotundata]